MLVSENQPRVTSTVDVPQPMVTMLLHTMGNGPLGDFCVSPAAEMAQTVVNRILIIFKRV